jgi:hypothetical protein
VLTVMIAIAIAILIGSYKHAKSFLPTYVAPLVSGEASQVLWSSQSSQPTTDEIPEDFQLAYRESLGYFDDVPEHHWLIRKQISRKRVHISTNSTVIQPYYQNNWNPDFSCEMEDFVGGQEPGKWVCDPHRLNRPNCLVYSVGSGLGPHFEKQLAQIAPYCEIHMFDYSDQSAVYALENLQNITITFHPWGIVDEEGYFFTTMKHKKLNRASFKTLTQTMETLGHTGRTLNLVKMVCETCEFHAYKGWLQHDIRQLLVETYFTAPDVNDFFQTFHDEGYVITHKEANLNRGGRTVEWAFLKLDKTFRELP